MISDPTNRSIDLFQKPSAEDCIIIIFGGSGDLAKRKLFPSLSHLHSKKYMPVKYHILAVGRKAMTIDDLLSMGDYPAEFRNNFEYVQTDYSPEGIEKLKVRTEEIASQKKIPSNFLFYLAIPPGGYAKVAHALKDGGMIYNCNGECWSRIVVEKPYGRDLQSSIELSEQLLSCFREDQIYRIDHYLGKEAVQNLLVFRFANLVFEPIWNTAYIDNIQINSSETLGSEDRADYFDSSGILRDMIQNHLMQLLCLVAMEPPVELTADAIRDEKVKVLRCMRPLDLQADPPVAIRGQYGRGNVGGENMPAYREEPGVPEDSNTETFAALRVQVENFRWAGVPFYLRAGKRMTRKGTEVVINFKKLPRLLFNNGPISLHNNRIVFKIQPKEGIILEVTSKNPGQSFDLGDTQMNFSYKNQFNTGLPDAYERLLLDAIIGDPTLFVRSDETELSWKFLDPLIKAWEGKPMGRRFPNYSAGTDGPDDSRELLVGGLKNWSSFGKYDQLG